MLDSCTLCPHNCKVNIEKKIKGRCKCDNKIKDAILFSKGLKMIHQDPFETLIAYIISQNNRVPSIANALNLLSLNYNVGHMIINYIRCIFGMLLYISLFIKNYNEYKNIEE